MHRRAGHRLDERVEPARDRQPVGRHLGGALTRGARERVVEGALQPGGTLPVDVHEPQHLRREGPGRVVALRHLEEPDAGQGQALELLRDIEVDLSVDEGERAVALERRPHLPGAQIEDVGDRLGLGAWVHDVTGVHVDVAGLPRDGERHARAIDDLPALGGQGGRPNALLQPHRLELGVVAHLQECQPHDDAAEGEQHQREHRDEPRDRRAGHPPPPAPSPFEADQRERSPGTRRITDSPGPGATMPTTSAHSAIREGDERRATSMSSSSFRS